MKALIVGGNGQLGRSLIAVAPVNTEIVSHDIDTLDITDKSCVLEVVKAVKPDVIFNAAAYTSVDKAECEEDVAYAVNASAVGFLAEAARITNSRLVHVSTDFVFDGQSSVPYQPTATAVPLSAYGRTKLAGEYLAGGDALIVRTSWVYAPTGSNFVRTMVKLMAERTELRIVSDQVGTPTYAPGLATALWTMVEKEISGLYHYTDSGVCSWYDFAVAIQEEAIAEGLLDRAIPLIPINTSEYPLPANRPHFSVLDKTSMFEILGGPTPHWRKNLRKMIVETKIYG